MALTLSGALPRAHEEALSSPTLWSGIPQADLESHGYVVEEFLLSATARLFADTGGKYPPTVRETDLPYTTRVLVMRPAQPSAFSGTVFLEAFPGYPTGDDDYNVVWSEAAEHVMRRGHAVVAVTCKRGGAQTLRAYDEARYASVHIADDGMMWDILGEAAALVRRPAGGGLLPGCDGAALVFAAGLSQSATILRTYLGERFPEFHSAERGHTIIDGFIIDVSSGGWGPAGYLGIAQNHDHVFDEQMRSVTEEAVALDDPRRSIRRPPVPVIEFMSEDEAIQHLWHQRPDSDHPADRYRCYQLAGRGHMSGLRSRSLYGPPQNIEVRRGYPLDSYEPWENGEQYPHRATKFLWAAMLDNMAAWVQDGVAPPRANPLIIDVPPGYVRDPRGVDYSALRPLEDADGNGLGGVRYLEIDVPTGRLWKLRENKPAGIGWWQHELWSPDELARRYEDAEGYRRQAQLKVDELVRERWYLAEDAADAVDAACGDFARATGWAS